MLEISSKGVAGPGTRRFLLPPKHFLADADDTVLYIRVLLYRQLTSYRLILNATEDLRKNISILCWFSANLVKNHLQRLDVGTITTDMPLLVSEVFFLRNSKARPPSAK